MALSIAELIIISLLVDWAFRKLRMPGLIGMLFAGVLLGPYVLGWLNPELLNVSPDLRLFALIVILLRAGLELSRKSLQRVSRMVLLLAVLPALVEIGVVTALGPWLLGLSWLESAILGAILGAVSPAVVVPLMIDLIDQRRGAEKGIPTLVLAAASIDDVTVIVIYSVLLGAYTGQEANIGWQLLGIPVSILLGIAAGLAVGMVLYRLFDRYKPRATKMALVVLGISILLVHLEHLLEGHVPFAALLAVMGLGFVLLERREHFAHQLSAKFSKIWIFAEILLFPLVGAEVNIHVALETGLAGAALILLGLAGRSIGSWISLLGSDLNRNERGFVVVAFLPKATVQAAIGGVPLVAMQAAGMDTEPGQVILATAVLSILLTAPAGAWAIAVTGQKALEVAPPDFPEDQRQAALESDEHGEDLI
jgi:NhaP-type Na+/H+ or K+/H+ antiporter